MGATPTADTDGIPTGHDTSNPIGLLAVTRTAPAIRPRVETPPSHRQSRSEQRNERNPSHVVMSDAANNNPKPLDNSMMESFFGTLQLELLDRRSWTTRTELASAIFEWIEGWYNPRRRHTSIGDLSPVEYERRPAAAAEAA